VLGVTQKMYDAEPSNGSTIVGVVKTFRDENPTTGVVLSNRTVDCIAVRNTSEISLEPGTVVRFSGAGVLSEVDGYATPTDTLIGVVDEYLPEMVGVPVGEVFWLVVKGPTSAWTAGDSNLSAGSCVTVSNIDSGVITTCAAGDDNELGVAIASTSSAQQRARILVKTRAS
jgi:hypothetical protein